MISVLLLALASAQDPARAPRLQLGDVYREARAASPRIQAARALALASRARVAPSGLLPDPQFQFGFMNYELPRLAPMDQIGMVQIQVMQMIPTAGKRGLSARIARLGAGTTGLAGCGHGGVRHGRGLRCPAMRCTRQRRPGQ